MKKIQFGPRGSSFSAVKGRGIRGVVSITLLKEGRRGAVGGSEPTQVWNVPEQINILLHITCLKCSVCFISILGGKKMWLNWICLDFSWHESRFIHKGRGLHTQTHTEHIVSCAPLTDYGNVTFVSFLNSQTVKQRLLALLHDVCVCVFPCRSLGSAAVSQTSCPFGIHNKASCSTQRGSGRGSTMATIWAL